MPFKVKSFCSNLTHDGEWRERERERKREREKEKIERVQEEDEV